MKNKESLHTFLVVLMNIELVAIVAGLLTNFPAFAGIVFGLGVLTAFYLHNSINKETTKRNTKDIVPQSSVDTYVYVRNKFIGLRDEVDSRITLTQNSIKKLSSFTHIQNKDLIDPLVEKLQTQLVELKAEREHIVSRGNEILEKIEYSEIEKKQLEEFSDFVQGHNIAEDNERYLNEIRLRIECIAENTKMLTAEAETYQLEARIIDKSLQEVNELWQKA
jgi:hypothetical protein